MLIGMSTESDLSETSGRPARLKHEQAVAISAPCALACPDRGPPIAGIAEPADTHLHSFTVSRFTRAPQVALRLGACHAERLTPRKARALQPT